jgi:hypothetical protein
MLRYTFFQTMIARYSFSAEVQQSFQVAASLNLVIVGLDTTLILSNSIAEFNAFQITIMTFIEETLSLTVAEQLLVNFIDFIIIS